MDDCNLATSKKIQKKSSQVFFVEKKKKKKKNKLTPPKNISFIFLQEIKYFWIYIYIKLNISEYNIISVEITDPGYNDSTCWKPMV